MTIVIAREGRISQYYSKSIILKPLRINPSMISHMADNEYDNDFTKNSSGDRTITNRSHPWRLVSAHQTPFEFINQ